LVDNNGVHNLGYAGYDPSKFGFLQKECAPVFSALNTDEHLAIRFRSKLKAELGDKHEGWLFFDFQIIKYAEEIFDWVLKNNTVLNVVDAFDEKHQINGGLLKNYNSSD
jgi:hypothetical protein